MIIAHTGFHEDDEHHTFGVMKKGVYRPLSDFNFHFIMKVVSDKSANTGYLVKVIPESVLETECESSSRYIAISIGT